MYLRNEKCKLHTHRRAAMSNGTVKAIRMMGYVDIIIGLGLVLGGVVLFRKNAT